MNFPLSNFEDGLLRAFNFHLGTSSLFRRRGARGRDKKARGLLPYCDGGEWQGMGEVDSLEREV